MFQKTIPRGFDSPTDLPSDPSEAKAWQDANRQFWQNTPMRYDWRTEVAPAEFSPQFYQEIDRRFLGDVSHYMPWREIPFDPVIPFAELATKDVLEIGVGCGTHAQIIAPHCKSYTGIDLTEYAAKCTGERMKLIGSPAQIVQMDAEKMQFANDSFDYIWSWGVIHHSSNTPQILREMHRILRPRGKATVMVYHRSWWHQYVLAGLFHGIIRGQLFKEKSLHRVLQTNIDGAIARYYKPREWRREVQELFTVERIRIYGSKTELIPLPGGRLKNFLMSATPDAVGRFFTNRLRFGLFLLAEMRVLPKRQESDASC